jgi:hypothetical protein
LKGYRNDDQFSRVPQSFQFARVPQWWSLRFYKVPLWWSYHFAWVLQLFITSVSSSYWKYFFKLLIRVVLAASSESPYSEASYQIIRVTSTGLVIVQSVGIASTLWA